MIIDDETTLGIYASRYLDTVSTTELLDWLDDSDPRVRTLIARNLQCRGTEEIFDFAMNWTTSAKAYQREVAAFILGQLGCLFSEDSKYPFKAKSKEILMMLVGDKNHEVRSATIAALGHLYIEELDKDIENLILEYANDKKLDVRIAISIALGSSSGKKKIIKVLKSYIKEGGELQEWAEVGMEILQDRLGKKKF